jgi:polar amino acid transport system substrate-binding protein
MLRRRALPVAVFALGAVVLTGCAQASSSASAGSASASADACSKANLTTLTSGKLTVGTDDPAYDPYFSDNTPSNGKGFESAVAYAVAQKLGFDKADVTWVKVPFDKSFAPGAKNFDFDINQISITPDRQKAVDMSDGYYTVNQAVVALKGTKAAEAKTIADLQALKLGAQVGTTSLTYVKDVVKPTQDPFVFSSTNEAKQALNNKTIDAIVVDLPTAYYITAAEIENSLIVGQFKADTAGGEQFGVVLAKGSPLTQCVNKAIGDLTSSGELASLQDEWLSKVTNAPYFS